jgi:methionyl-tRNA formyltransferase
MRIAVLSNIPEIAQISTEALRRGGQEAVGVIAARRRTTTPGLSNIDEHTNLGRIPICLAQRSDCLEPIIRELKPDLLLSWAFPWRIPDGALGAAPLGGINLHPSILPRHRGINPLGWTLRSGDDEYGITWHRMTSTFDAGDIITQFAFEVTARETPELFNLKVSIGALKTLPYVLAATISKLPGKSQDHSLATLAPPFGEDYALVDFRQPVRRVHDQVRAWALAQGTGSAPGPFATIEDRLIRVLRTSLDPVPLAPSVRCPDGFIWLARTEEVDPPISSARSHA